MVGVDELAEHVQAVFRLAHHVDGRSEILPRSADALRPDLFLRSTPFVELIRVGLLVGGDQHVDPGRGEAVLQGRLQQRLRVDHAGQPDGVDACGQGRGHGDLQAVQVVVREAIAAELLQVELLEGGERLPALDSAQAAIALGRGADDFGDFIEAQSGCGGVQFVAQLHQVLAEGDGAL